MQCGTRRFRALLLERRERFYCMEAGFDIATNGLLAGGYVGPSA